MIQDIIAWICIAAVVLVCVAYAIRYFFFGTADSAAEMEIHEKDDQED